MNDPEHPAPERCTCGDPCTRCGGCNECCECLPDRAAVEAARSAFAATLTPDRAAEWRQVCALVDAENAAGGAAVI